MVCFVYILHWFRRKHYSRVQIWGSSAEGQLFVSHSESYMLNEINFKCNSICWMVHTAYVSIAVTRLSWTTHACTSPFMRQLREIKLYLLIGYMYHGEGVASGLFITENNKVTFGYSNLYHFCFTPWYSLTVLTLLAWLQIKKKWHPTNSEFTKHKFLE